MNAFTWLNDFMVWLAKWFPRLTLIKAGHAGVLFSRRGRLCQKQAGLHVWWPIAQDLTVVSTRVRSTEIAGQFHGSEVISLVVRYRIAEPVVMLLRQNDVFSMLDDRTQAHLGRAFGQGVRDSVAICICACVATGLADDFRDDGLEIVSVDVAQRGAVLPVKLLQDWAQHSKSELA